VTYAVVESGNGSPPSLFTVLGRGALPIPKALWIPQQLHFIRTVLLDVMSDFEVKRAGLRLTEMVALSPNVFRDNIEGVIQEMLAASAVELYVAGRNVLLSGRLGLADKTLFKKYCSGDATPPYANGWDKFALEEREACLAAIAALMSTPDLATSALAHGVGAP